MIESAKYELKLALTFAKISSTAYQGGNLKHAAGPLKSRSRTAKSHRRPGCRFDR